MDEKEEVFLLLVIGEAWSESAVKDILNRVAEGLSCYSPKGRSELDLNTELLNFINRNVEPEISDEGTITVRAAGKLFVKVLVRPTLFLLEQTLKEVLTSCAKYKHIVHAGPAVGGSGDWMLNGSLFRFRDLARIVSGKDDVVVALRDSFPGSRITLSCIAEGPWNNASSKAQGLDAHADFVINPTGKNPEAATSAVGNFVTYLQQWVTKDKQWDLADLLPDSPIAGNITLKRPTFYVFPGGQGDCALFGIPGYNLLMDGGYGRRPAYWDLIRYLSQIDGLLLSNLDADNVQAVSSLVRRNARHPTVGCLLGNIPPPITPAEPSHSLIYSVVNEGAALSASLVDMGVKPVGCHFAVSAATKRPEMINLYQKLGHGRLDMCVLSPARDSKEVKELAEQWKKGNLSALTGADKSLTSATSVATLVVWNPTSGQPTRFLYPGSCTQEQIFPALEKMKQIEFLKSWDGVDAAKPAAGAPGDKKKAPAAPSNARSSVGPAKKNGAGPTQAAKPLAAAAASKAKPTPIPRQPTPDKSIKAPKTAAAPPKSLARSESPKEPAPKAASPAAAAASPSPHPISPIAISPKADAVPPLQPSSPLQMQPPSPHSPAMPPSPLQQQQQPSPKMPSPAFERSPSPIMPSPALEQPPSPGLAAPPSAASASPVSSPLVELSTQSELSAPGPMSPTVGHADDIPLEATASSQSPLHESIPNSTEQVVSPVPEPPTHNTMDLQEQQLFRAPQQPPSPAAPTTNGDLMDQSPVQDPGFALEVDRNQYGDTSVLPQELLDAVSHGERLLDTPQLKALSPAPDEIDQQSAALSPDSIGNAVPEAPVPTIPNNLDLELASPVEGSLAINSVSPPQEPIPGQYDASPIERRSPSIGSDANEANISPIKSDLNPLAAPFEPKRPSPSVSPSSPLVTDVGESFRPSAEFRQASKTSPTGADNFPSDDPFFASPVGFAPPPAQPDAQSQPPVAEDSQGSLSELMSKIQLDSPPDQSHLTQQSAPPNNTIYFTPNGAGADMSLQSESTNGPETVENTPVAPARPEDAHQLLDEMKNEWGEPLSLPPPASSSARSSGASGIGKPGAARPKPGAAAAAAAKKPGAPATGRAPTAKAPAATKSGPAAAVAAKKTAAPSATRPGAKPAPAAPAAKKAPPPAKSTGMGRASVGAKTGSAAAVPKKAAIALTSPVYLDLAYIPRGADKDFFRLIRSRYYVLSTQSPQKDTLQALLEGKRAWAQPEAITHLIPTYDSATLHLWMQLNRDELENERIEILPSAVRCALNLEETSADNTCAAYRLEL